MSYRRHDDHSLTLECERCGKSEWFAAYVGCDTGELFTEADREDGCLPIWQTGDWLDGGQVLCPGCITTIDLRRENIACVRCGKEDLEDDETEAGPLIVAPLDPSVEEDLVCGGCYSDEDRRWGHAELERLRELSS